MIKKLASKQFLGTTVLCVVVIFRSMTGKQNSNFRSLYYLFAVLCSRVDTVKTDIHYFHE